MFSLISSRFGSCEVRRLNRALGLVMKTKELDEWGLGTSLRSFGTSLRSICTQNGGKSTCLAAFITAVGCLVAVLRFIVQSHSEILVCIREEEKKWPQQNV